MKGISKELVKHLRAPDGDARIVADALVTEAQDQKDSTEEWATDDGILQETKADFTIWGGRLQLSRDSQVSVATNEVEDGTTNAGLKPLDFDNFDGSVALIELAGSEPFGTKLTQVIARLDPDTGGGQEVVHWRCRVFTVGSYEVIGGKTTIRELIPIHSGHVQVDAGVTEEVVTFNFGDEDFPILKQFTPQPPPDGSGSFREAPIVVINIYGVKADGEIAANTAWLADSVDSVDDDGDRIRQFTFESKPSDGGWEITDDLQTPYIRLNTERYPTSGTIEFTTNPLDLGVVPENDVEFLLAKFEPPGTSVTVEVREVGGAYVEVKSGQTHEDLGIPKTNKYELRITLDAGGAQHLTPILFYVIARAVDRRDLDGLVRPRLNGRWGTDAVSKRGEIVEMRMKGIYSGERDYRDPLTEVLSEFNPKDIEFDIWYGYGDRDETFENWLLLDKFFYDDHESTNEGIEILAYGAMIKIRNITLPKKENDIRQVYEYDDTLENIWSDLLQNQAEIDSRFLENPPDDTTIVHKERIEDTNVEDELHAVSFLAGGTYVQNKGRIGWRRMHDDDQDGHRPVIIWDRNEIAKLRATPGYRYRMPEVTVLYDYNWEEEKFTKEHYATHAQAILAHSLDTLDKPEEIDEYILQYIDTQEIAAKVAARQVDTMGPGLMVWSLKTTYPWPEAEVGDKVVVPTDLFIAKSPYEEKAIRGFHYVIARILNIRDMEHREFDVWVQSYDDIIASDNPVTREGFLTTMQASHDEWELIFNLTDDDPGGPLQGWHLHHEIQANPDFKSVNVKTSTGEEYDLNFPAGESSFAHTVRDDSSGSLDPPNKKIWPGSNGVIGGSGWVEYTPYTEIDGAQGTGVPGKPVRVPLPEGSTGWEEGGASGYVLTQTESGLPTWQQVSGGGISPSPTDDQALFTRAGAVTWDNIGIGDVTPGSDDQFAVTRAGTPTWDDILASDVPNLAASKITSGVFPMDRYPHYEAGVASLAADTDLPTAPETALIFGNDDGFDAFAHPGSDAFLKALSAGGYQWASGTEDPRIPDSDYVGQILRGDSTGGWVKAAWGVEAAGSADRRVLVYPGGTDQLATWETLIADDLPSHTHDESDITGTGSLTKTDDANVTLTLGGTPTGALLKGVSLGLGWSNTLALSRGGTGADLSADVDLPTAPEMAVVTINDAGFDVLGNPGASRFLNVNSVGDITWQSVSGTVPDSDASGRLLIGDGSGGWVNSAWAVTSEEPVNPEFLRHPGGLNQTALWDSIAKSDLPGLNASDIGPGTFPSGGHTFAGAVTMGSTLDVTGAILAQAGVEGDGNLPFAIDANNDQTGRRFVWLNNGLSGTELMRLVEDGHLALGTTDVGTHDEDWGMFRMGHAGIIGGRLNADQLTIGSNYQQVGNSPTSNTEYLTSDPATMLFFTGGGTIILRTAPSGTADTAISWTDALTIQNDGDLAMLSGKRLFLDGGSDTYIDESSANLIRFVTGGNNALVLNLGSDLRAYKDFVPNSAGLDLGDPAVARWSTIYGVDLDLSGDIGAPGSRVSNIYTSFLSSDGNVAVGGQGWSTLETRSTGGTNITLNYDNGNSQKVTLTGSGATITIGGSSTNQRSGACYTTFLTASGGSWTYSISGVTTWVTTAPDGSLAQDDTVVITIMVVGSTVLGWATGDINTPV